MDAGNVGNYIPLSTEPVAEGAPSGAEFPVALCEEPLGAICSLGPPPLLSASVSATVK